MENVTKNTPVMPRIGDARSCIVLGRMYWSGDGVPRDISFARALYYSAEISEDPDAVREMARMYGEGDCCSEDPVRARELMLRADGLEIAALRKTERGKAAAE